jgi:hypothetical protein
MFTQEHIDRDIQIQTAMEQCYFSNELLMPDMGKFQGLVEANKQYLLGIGRYQELSNYVDTKAAAKCLLRAVKAIVLKAEHGTDSQPYLCDKTLTALFSNELPKFYYRAAKQLATFIKQ